MSVFVGTTKCHRGGRIMASKKASSATKKAGVKKTAVATVAPRQGARKAASTSITATRTTAAKKAAAKAAAKKTTAPRTTVKSAATKSAVGKAATTTAAAKKAAVSRTVAKKAAPSRTVAKKAAPSGTATGEAAPPKAAVKASARPQRLRVRDNETPWTTRELATVRAELEADIERLQREISVAELDLVDLMRDAGEGSGDDQADAGTATFEREQEISLANNARGVFEQSARALARLLDGSYGVCESCGSSIGKNRLLAFPRATLCMTCKSKQERR